MKHIFVSLALDTAKGLGFIAASMAIFAAISMLWFRLSPRLKHDGGVKRAIDYAFPRKLYARPGAKVDLGLMILNTFFFGPAISLFATLFAALDLTQVLVAHFGRPAISVQNSWVILTVQFLVGTLSGELSFYAYHRLTHKNRFFWTTHRVHHSAEEMTFLTGGRGHPLDGVGFVLSRVIIAAPLNGIGLYFTGVAAHPLLPTVLLAYGIFSGVENAFNHSHVPSSFGPLNYIFISGHMHQIHHSSEIRHRDKNFGATMSLFDWIFRTLYIPRAGETPRLGLNGDQLGENNPHQSVRDCLLEPIVYLKDQIHQRSRAGG
jgi:sterol desaturase/sphingolipid hydroxylase (fatty acid hydroxylase superfamily)